MKRIDKEENVVSLLETFKKENMLHEYEIFSQYLNRIEEMNKTIEKQSQHIISVEKKLEDTKLDSPNKQILLFYLEEVKKDIVILRNRFVKFYVSVKESIAEILNSYMMNGKIGIRLLLMTYYDNQVEDLEDANSELKRKIKRIDYCLMQVREFVQKKEILSTIEKVFLFVKQLDVALIQDNQKWIKNLKQQVKYNEAKIDMYFTSLEQEKATKSSISEEVELDAVITFMQNVRRNRTHTSLEEPSIDKNHTFSIEELQQE